VEVIAPGTRVVIGDQKIDGHVSAVTITGGGQVEYKVYWWEGGSRHEEWVTAAEVTRYAEPTTPLRIGFSAGS
jgi:hypothetical protein